MQAVKNAVHKVTGNSSSGSGQTVLITGGSGFVAASVLNSFLSRGYHVRTTVRNAHSAEKVKKSHSKYLKQLEFAYVADVAAPGAFDEAVKGVGGVIHTASPFVLSVEDNTRDLLDPAIKGTTSILHAIKKYNPNVKRVVITSSFAAIVDLSKGLWPGHVYTEADWNPVTYEAAATGDGVTAYCASKTFAEKAAWEFVEKEKPNFMVSTINPPMVYGPPEHTVEDMSKLNISAADIYRLISGAEKEVPQTNFFGYVDVRDVAEAHLKAYELEEAAGQRYFTTSGGYTYQMFCDIIRRKFPELNDRVPEGKPGDISPYPDGVYQVDNSKASRELGIKFRDMETVITDTVKRLVELEASLKA